MHTQAEQRSVLAHPWRIAALVAIVANVTFSYVSGRIGSDARTVAQVSDLYPTLFTPAGYAFAIWGLIYAATLAYGVLALLPSQMDVRMHDRVAPWLLLTNALGCVWILLFTGEHLAASVLVILAMLASSGVGYLIVSSHLKSEHLSRWWRTPFSLWLGWLSVATIANFSIALVAAGWDGSPLSAPVWATIMLCVAAAVALIINVIYGDPVVPLVVSWAAAAIAVAHWQDSTLVAIVATLIAVKCVLWAAATILFDLFPMPRRYRDAAKRALQYDPQNPSSL